MKLPKATPKKATDARDIPAQIQFRAWFGPEGTIDDWDKACA